MPNWCFFLMYVTCENKENLKEFRNVVYADYDYRFDKFSCDRHMFRFLPDTMMDNGIWETDDGYRMTFSGACAWSVYDCMFKGAGTYYDKVLNMCAATKQEFHGTDIITESRNLGLDIEIYSQELGMCFEEHYIIKHGELVCDEERDIHPVFYDVPDIDWEEFRSLVGYRGSEEDFWTEHPDGVIVQGGFGQSLELS